MNAVLTPTKMSFESYLAWESGQATKHEFIDGEVFAMVGVRLNHNRITLNAALALRAALAGQPCAVFASDVKVKVAQAERAFYPDIAVTCDAADLADGNALYVQRPWLIAEVLSDSTAAYDRGVKFEHYRHIPSLTHYLLIETNRPHADLFCKNGDGLWVLHPLSIGDVWQVQPPQAFEVPVQALFDGVSFDADTHASPQA